MPRWSSLSDDPNSSTVSKARFVAIQNRRAGQLIEDRVKYLAKAVAGLSILDIGVVAHTKEAVAHPQWLHGHLSRSASKCLGVDILPESVEFLQSQGFNVKLADLIEGPLPETFDLIVAGEVLEHLSSPGRLVESCAAMLPQGGRLFVTVPNPWYINAIIKNLRRSSVFIDSADHVVWYDPNSIYELGQRSGLELVKWSGISVGKQTGLISRFVFGTSPFLIAAGFAPELFAKSILYEFIKD